MDIQTRKLKAIEYLIELNDEQEFKLIESAIAVLKKNRKAGNFQPMAVEEVLNRANISDLDYKAGRVKTQEDVELESRNW